MKRILASLIDSDGFGAILSALRDIAQERGGNASKPKSRYWVAMASSLAQLRINELHHKEKELKNEYE